MKKWQCRQAWFKSKVGKRLYRTRGLCTCEPCQRVYRDGLIVTDELHAIYLFDMECEVGLHYYSTRWRARVAQVWKLIRKITD